MPNSSIRQGLRDQVCTCPLVEVDDTSIACNLCAAGAQLMRKRNQQRTDRSCVGRVAIRHHEVPIKARWEGGLDGSNARYQDAVRPLTSDNFSGIGRELSNQHRGPVRSRLVCVGDGAAESRSPTAVAVPTAAKLPPAMVGFGAPKRTVLTWGITADGA